MGQLIQADIPRWTHKPKRLPVRLLSTTAPVVLVTDHYRSTCPHCDGGRVEMFGFDAPRLTWAILNTVGDAYFTATDREDIDGALKPFANALRYYKPREAEELLAAIGDMSTWQLGKALDAIATEAVVFWGYRLRKIVKEKNIWLYQLQKG